MLYRQVAEPIATSLAPRIERVRLPSASMIDDPAAAAWVHARRPQLPYPYRVDAEPCARCGAAVETVRSAEVISEQFTGFDAWPYGMRRLCTPCAWCYAAFPPAGAKRWMTITRERTTYHRSTSALAQRLAAGPLTSDVAVVLAVSARHSPLAGARWGRVQADTVSVPWTQSQADRLQAVRRLRDAGATWPELDDRQPPRSLLSRYGPAQWITIAADWEQMDPWREIPTLWSMAKALTR